ncbi:hypothetical protein SD70_27740 [Gordoniibacillus kamchatkensis]|uniref:Uncharacterized protein n=1 Tax=Gordoniibacillus kamchatkensis TaxID=1590651 RepID=A0ABR5AB53_9BACL|nr:hypothetical protein [Paenibacillus sp. VKM B-2647]KIL38222.1 hypothetical protein SD70_27740 [Paenibacillus sp. VKM B-2647]
MNDVSQEQPSGGYEEKLIGSAKGSLNLYVRMLKEWGVRPEHEAELREYIAWLLLEIVETSIKCENLQAKLDLIKTYTQSENASQFTRDNVLWAIEKF